MLRVSHNYVHKDFSYLLNMPCVAAPAATASATAAKVTVSPAKRRRDSLLSNRNMKYIISKAGDECHDRDCPSAVSIPDELFDMCLTLPDDKRFCPKCFRKAVIRSGLAADLSKYMDAAVNLFNRCYASTMDLRMLFIANNAAVLRVEQDRIYLKVHDDCWIVRHTDNGCLLYHNNYTMLNAKERLMQDGFHLQVDRAMPFRHAALTMCQYSWSGHLKLKEEQRKLLNQAKLRQALVSLSPFIRLPRPSLLYRYYRVADVGDHLANAPFPVKILSAQPQPETACTEVICRISRWRTRSFLAVADAISLYVIAHERNDYIPFCRRMLDSCC